MLRQVLIIFGWMIPLVAALLMVSQIYIDLTYNSQGGQYAVDPWVSVTRSICNAIQDLALSPLCFFGAYMLGKHKELSND